MRKTLVLLTIVMLFAVNNSSAMAGGGGGDYAHKPLMMVYYEDSYYRDPQDGITKIEVMGDCKDLDSAIVILNGKIVQFAIASRTFGVGSDDEGAIDTKIPISKPGHYNVFMISFAGNWPFIKVCLSKLDEIYIPEIDVYADAQFSDDNASINVIYNFTNNFASAPVFYDGDNVNVQMGNIEREGSLDVTSSYDAQVTISFTLDEYQVLDGSDPVRTNFEISGVRFAPDVYYSDPYSEE